MKIPIFVSSPTELNKDQDRSRNVIMNMLDDLQLEPRALGRSDYPKDVPLREIYVIARHCYDSLFIISINGFIEMMKSESKH